MRKKDITMKTVELIAVISLMFIVVLAINLWGVI
jgi:hypothetical protein